MKFFAILMAFIYIALGIFLLVQQKFNLAYKIPLGIVLIVYGLFRAFSTYQKFSRGRENDDRYL
mgnify:FL=1